MDRHTNTAAESLEQLLESLIKMTGKTNEQVSRLNKRIAELERRLEDCERELKNGCLCVEKPGAHALSEARYLFQL